MRTSKKLGAIAFAFVLAAGALCAGNPEAEKLLVQAGTLYQLKAYDEALGAYGKSLRMDNTSAAGYQGVGNCYYAKGDKAHAVKYYRYALQLNPNNTRLRNFVDQLQGAPQSQAYLAGNQFYRQQRYDEAISQYRAATAENPRNAKAWQGLGNCYYAKGDKEQAVSSYKKSVEIDPSNTALSNFLASYQRSSSPSMASAGNGGWFQAGWRSAILPGWGQAYNGEGGKGLFLGLFTGALLVGEVASYSAGMSARNEYLSAGRGADFDKSYSAWESMASLNHGFYIGMTAVYAYTLVDAIWNAKSPSAQARALRAPVDIAFDKGGIKLKADLLQF